MKKIVDRYRGRRIVALATLVALLLLAGPLAERSEAGIFPASECAAWNTYSQARYSENHHMLVVERQCWPGGDGLLLGAPQNVSSGFGSEARFQVDAPPGMHFVSVWVSQRGHDSDGWRHNVEACGPLGCSTLGSPADGVWTGAGTPAGNYWAWYARLYCLNASCAGAPQAFLAVRDVVMTMSDDSPPTLRERGQLLNGEVQRGAGRLDVSASDIGAGLASVWVLVNGQEIGRRNLPCQGIPMQPCPADGGPLAFTLNTQSTPFHDGDNAVKACGIDFGDPGNVACSSEVNVRVDNSCIDSKVPGGTDLSALFARNRKNMLGVRAGQGALLSGRLTDSSGAPVPGASLCVREGIAGQGLDDEGTVKTDKNGRYQYGVAPGPNRNLVIGYRYDRKQLDRSASFFSKLRPRLKLSHGKTRNGHSIRLHGSIPGPSNNDRVVILQAGYPHSGKWKTFSKARTGAQGTYLARYRFTSTFQTTTYRMRAVVPKQNGYPYAGGASRPRTVKVLGR